MTHDELMEWARGKPVMIRHNGGAYEGFLIDAQGRVETGRAIVVDLTGLPCATACADRQWLADQLTQAMRHR